MIAISKYKYRNVGWLMLSGILVLSSCGNDSTAENGKKETPKVYKKPSAESGLGDLSLMGENLAVTQFLNGDKIQEAKSKSEWVNAGKNKQAAFCYASSENQFGKKEVLYNYYALTDPRGLVSNEKLLTKTEMESWLKNWNNEPLSLFADMYTEERNYAGTFFDLGIVNWWLLADPLESEENGSQAYVLGWAIEGNHASIQLASTANGFYIRCKK